MHGERDELGDANKSVGTRKKFGMGRDGRDASHHFEAMHCCMLDVMRTGITVGKLRHGGCQAVSRWLLSPARKMLEMWLFQI